MSRPGRLHPLVRMTIKRLALLPLSLVVIVTVSFLIIELMPGDPAFTIAGPYATEADLERIRAQLGLDRPPLERYWQTFVSLATFDFGSSFFTDRPIAAELARFFPATLELLLASLLIAVVLGMTIGLIGAYFVGRAPERAARAVTTAFQSVPDFLLGLVLIYLLFYVLGVAPPPVGRLGLLDAAPERVTGMYTVDALIAGDLAGFGRALAHLALPSLAVGIVYSSYIAKTTYATMVQALRSVQVEYARACGLPGWQVLRYALLEGRVPIITYGAILMGALAGGIAVVETVFAWRGVGEWGLNAILALDVPAIQGFIVVVGVFTILVYLALDLVVALLDPRIRYE